MTATEKRAVFMGVAAQLQAELQRIREEIRPISQMVADLVAAGDSLLKASVEEKTSGNAPKVSSITLPAVLDVVSIKEGEVIAVPVNIERALTNLPSLGKGKRACSICRKPGHRKQNCPDADKAYKARKTKRTVSPERRAQLAKALAKARAARGKGKR